MLTTDKTQAIVDTLAEDCLTTDKLARLVEASEDEVRAACVALAREGRIFLASYGWNQRLAWCDVEFADDILHRGRHEERTPWDMTARDRSYILGQ
jgi:hypothetical protein